MQEIKITSNNYIPNIKILKNHIVTFKKKCIDLYDIKGNLLDSSKIDSKYKIHDICFINDNYLIAHDSNHLFSIIVKDEKLDIFENNQILFLGRILDIIYSKINKILIISLNYFIDIRDIDCLNKPIQTINIENSFLLNINQDIFIAYNYNNMFLYNKIKGKKYYQLSLKKEILPFEFNYNYKKLLKLDNKSLLMAFNNILYLINIKTMKVYQGLELKNYRGKIIFINKIKDNIYVCKEDNLLSFKYSQNKVILIASIYQNNLFSLNYIYNLFLKKNFPNLNIIINCIKNNKIKKNIFFPVFDEKAKLAPIKFSVKFNI